MHNQIKIILEKEQQRQDTTVELIASENYASQAVMDLCGSIFTNKYAAVSYTHLTMPTNREV